MEKQIELEKDLTEIFDKEYEKRNLITPKNTAEKLTAKGYCKQVDIVDEIIELIKEQSQEATYGAFKEVRLDELAELTIKILKKYKGV